MNKAKISLLIPLAALAVAALACNFLFRSAAIEDAWMAFDQEGALRTGTYRQDDIFYAIVLLENTPDDTEIKAVFYADQVEGEQADTRIDDAVLTAGSGQVYFTLSNPALWPPGGYRVDLYLNNEFERSLTFEVQGPPTPTPEPTPTATKPPAAPQPNIADAYLSLDDAGEQVTTVYGPDDIFYCKVEVVDAAPDSLIRADWYAVEVEGIEPNSLIDSAEISGGDNLYTFDLAGSQPWPEGDYMVEISINNITQVALEFKVTTDRGPAAVVSYAYLSLDEDGFEPTTTFDIYDVFYCIAEVEGSNVDNTIEAVWYAVNVPGYERNAVLYSSTIEGGAETYTFQLFSDQEWSPGLYAVELFIDDELQILLEFQVG